MSTRTQEKFAAQLQALADERNLDLVVEGSYANVGTYSFQPRDSFDPVLTFPFTFNDGRASFVPVLGGRDPGPLGPRHERTKTGFVGAEGEMLDAVLVRVGELLDGAGALPGKSAPEPQEEALTQIQHLAYDASFQLESRKVTGEDALTLARIRLDRINAIAEGCHPDEQWIPIREDSAGDVVQGGDRELLAAES